MKLYSLDKDLSDNSGHHIQQVNDEYEIRDEALQKYLFKVKVKIGHRHLEYFKFEQIPKE